MVLKLDCAFETPESYQIFSKSECCLDEAYILVEETDNNLPNII